MAFQANSKGDLDQWVIYSILCGIEDKLFPAANGIDLVYQLCQPTCD